LGQFSDELGQILNNSSRPLHSNFITKKRIYESMCNFYFFHSLDFSNRDCRYSTSPLPVFDERKKLWDFSSDKGTNKVGKRVGTCADWKRNTWEISKIKIGWINKQKTLII